VREAAQAVAGAWTQPIDPESFSRGISQLYSVLRDLGIATRGLARYQTAGNPANPAPPRFRQAVTASAVRLLGAGQCLGGVLAAEGLGPVPDPDEPGAVLCRAARTAITAWRRPAGPSTDRDATIEQLITAIGFLGAATRSLTAYAPRRRAIDVDVVVASLAEATSCLAGAIPSSAHPSDGAE
jgi:hypothetical protein